MTVERPLGLIRGSGRRGGSHRLERVVSVRVDDPLLASVRELAAADGISVSDWMRRAVGCAVHERHQPPVMAGRRAVGWECRHVSITSVPGVLGKTTCASGCEMQPIYATA